MPSDPSPTISPSSPEETVQDVEVRLAKQLDRYRRLGEMVCLVGGAHGQDVLRDAIADLELEMGGNTSLPAMPCLETPPSGTTTSQFLNGTIGGSIGGVEGALVSVDGSAVEKPSSAPTTKTSHREPLQGEPRAHEELPKRDGLRQTMPLPPRSRLLQPSNAVIDRPLVFKFDRGAVNVKHPEPSSSGENTGVENATEPYFCTREAEDAVGRERAADLRAAERAADRASAERAAAERERGGVKQVVQGGPGSAHVVASGGMSRVLAPKTNIRQPVVNVRGGTAGTHARVVHNVASAGEGRGGRGPPRAGTPERATRGSGRNSPGLPGRTNYSPTGGRNPSPMNLRNSVPNSVPNKRGTPASGGTPLAKSAARAERMDRERKFNPPARKAAVESRVVGQPSPSVVKTRVLAEQRRRRTHRSKFVFNFHGQDVHDEVLLFQLEFYSP